MNNKYAKLLMDILAIFFIAACGIVYLFALPVDKEAAGLIFVVCVAYFIFWRGMIFDE